MRKERSATRRWSSGFSRRASLDVDRASSLPTA